MIRQRPTQGNNNDYNDMLQVWDVWYWNLRMNFLYQVPHFFVDLVACPFACLALVSPLRSRLFRDNITHSRAIRNADIAGQTGNHLNYLAGSFEYQYCFEARKFALRYGVLAITDIFLIPLMLPLWITWYRYRAIMPMLQKAVWEWEEIHLIAGQCFLLFTDAVVLLPTLPVLFLTGIRWSPVGDILALPDVLINHSFDLYSECLNQMMVLLLDLLVLPLVIVVLVTHYRSGPVRIIWHHLRLRNSGLLYHRAVVVNFIVLLHDLVFLLPLMTCTALMGFYRVPVLIGILQKYRQYHSDSIAAGGDNSQLNGRSTSNHIEMSHTVRNRMKAQTLDAMRASTCSDPGSRDSRDSTLSSVDSSGQVISANTSTAVEALPEFQIFPSWNSRAEVTFQFVSVFLDIPFFILGIIVLLTIWRANELIIGLSRIWQRRKTSQAANSTRNDVEMRYLVATEFGLLCRDIVFLVPFVAVVATMYRLPNVIISLTSRFNSTKPLITDETLLVLSSSSMEFAERGGVKMKFAGKCHNGTTECTESEEPYLELADNEELDYDAGVEIFFLGDSLWSQASSIFGSTIISVLRALLPIKLINGSGINFDELISQLVTVRLPPSARSSSFDSRLSFGRDSNGQIDKSIDKTNIGTDRASIAIDIRDSEPSPFFDFDAINFWLRLDLGDTKRSSIIKKLCKLPGESVMVIQLECKTRVNSNVINLQEQRSQNLQRKVILARLHPTVSQLLDILENDEASGDLPACALTSMKSTDNPKKKKSAKHAYRTFTNHKKLASNNGGLVNSFYLVVGLAFVDIIVDFFYLILFVLTMLNPWRAINLIASLLEPEYLLPLRVAENCIRILSHADAHLREYRATIAPLFNSISKKSISNRLKLEITANDGESSLIGDILVKPEVSPEELELIKTAELAYLYPYQHLMNRIEYALTRTNGCEEILSLTKTRKSLHESLVHSWALRNAAHLQLMDKSINSEKYAVVIAVLTEDHDKTAISLSRNTSMLADVLGTMKVKASYDYRSRVLKSDTSVNNTERRHNFGLSNSGLFVRPIKTSRSLIQFSFYQAVSDYVFAALLIILLVTVVRTMPLYLDLMTTKSWSPARYTTRCIIKKHVVGLWHDVIHILKFLVYVGFIIGTVIGIPGFLVDLPLHLTSCGDAATCAHWHLTNTLDYLMELFMLVFALRSYRIVIKSALYGVLVPAACLAEASPFSSVLSPLMKFCAGFCVWLALLIGAVKASINAATVGEVLPDDMPDKSSTVGVAAALMGITGALFLVLSLSAIVVSYREVYTNPSIAAVSLPKLSWSHALAVLTGPMESLQLSAIIMYFYWQHGSFLVDYESTSVFASKLLLWGPQGGGDAGFDSAMNLAACLVFVWAVLVSLPLAVGGDDARRQDKTLHVKNSPLYEFFMVILSRIFTVWIIATLMRPCSCVNIIGSTEVGDAWKYVASTATTVACGGDGGWASLASLALLVYFGLTSAILHADDADLLKTNVVLNTQAVRFAPLYALLMRAGQLFICAVSMGGFLTLNTTAPLVPIIFMSAALATCPMCFSKDVCSFAAVVPLRSAGAICVVWTAFVCLCRDRSTIVSNGIFQSEKCVFIGWGLIYFFAIFWAIYCEHRKKKEWLAALHASGLEETIVGLTNTFKVIFVDEALFGKKGSSVETRITFIQQQAQQSQSPGQLAVMLTSFEEMILTERLTLEFLTHRQTWQESLSMILSVSFYEKSRDSVDLNESYVENSHDDNSRVPKPPILPITNSADLDIFTNRTSNSSNNNNNNHQQYVDHTNTVMLENSWAAVPSSQAFRHIKYCAQSLLFGLRPLPNTTAFSRQVLTILFSHRLPMDTCWHIFGYFFNSQALREILDRKMPMDSAYLCLPSVLSPVKTDQSFAIDLLMTCCGRLASKRQEIVQANVTYDVSNAATNNRVACGSGTFGNLQHLPPLPPDEEEPEDNEAPPV